MKRAFVLCFFFPTVALASVQHEKPWHAWVHSLSHFSSRDIHALAIADDHLYVSSSAWKLSKKNTIFEVIDLKSGNITDLSKKLKIGPQDRVTSILVNLAKQEIWIGTNNNTWSSDCYDSSLNLKAKNSPTDSSIESKCEKGFLDSYVGQYSKFSGSNQSSVETVALDSQGGVFGRFKGGIYLVSKEGKAEWVYTPSNTYHWPVSSALTATAALVGTRGDGLISVNRKNKRVAEFPDDDPNFPISAIAVSGKRIFLGSVGLFEGRVADFQR